MKFQDDASLKKCIAQLREASQRCHPDDAEPILEAAHALGHMATGMNILVTALMSAMNAFTTANTDLETLTAQIEDEVNARVNRKN